MTRSRQHPKIQERKKQSTLISYTNVGVNDLSTLDNRASLLDERIVEGYGCVWGSRNMHGEKFVRGAFAKSIKENGPGSDAAYQIKFRDEHGRACALFDEIREDETGLYFRTKPLDNVSWCDDLLTQLRSGTINNFSNGFKTIWDKVEYEEETDSLIMMEARLFEISAVAIPSDLATFALRTAEEPEYLEDDTEDFIKSLPRSKQLECRKIIARHQALAAQKEPPARKPALEETPEPQKKGGIDYTFLLNNIKKN